MGKKLAILGHPTRGWEIIDVLKMMGGVNGKINRKNGRVYNIYNGDYIHEIGGYREVAYYIDFESQIRYIDIKDITTNFIVYSLEMFLKTFPFKVWDKVFLYDNITEGCVTGMEWDEDKGTVKYCVYTSAEYWCDVKELLKWNNANLNERNYMDNMEEKDKAKAPDIKGEDYSGKRFGYKIPDGYEFDVVVDGKIFLKPIKPKYPTTYAECKEMLPENVYYGYSRFMTLQKLIICRDVYWKIYGEQMGLGEPWEPKFGKIILFSIKFYLYQDSFILHKGEYSSSDNCILVFPTEEMRDSFYENFKDLIEQCKEML